MSGSAAHLASSDGAVALLYFTAILGGASLCIFLALPGTPSAFTRRPEPYLLAFFYALLPPSALINVLWRPHRLLVEWRERLILPVAKAFNDTIAAAGSVTTAEPGRLRGTTDLLSDISRAVRCWTRRARPGRSRSGGSGRRWSPPSSRC
jgi:hypothetical protein